MERGERTILVAVPVAETARELSQAFRFHGLRPMHVTTAAEALASLAPSKEDAPDLVVMDLAQPDADGLVLVADIRARTRAPIIVCGDREGRSEALLAFRLGADDFVTKPFEVDDVVARAEAALRRSAESSLATDEGAGGGRPAMGGGERGVRAGEHMQMRGVGDGVRDGSGAAGAAGAVTVVGDLALDAVHHQVAVGGEDVRLSRSEYLLLAALMSRPDELLSRLDLARAVWGEQLAQIGRPIDQHMYRLRSKLQAAARKAGVAAPVIASVPGFGYRLLVEAQEERAAA